MGKATIIYCIVGFGKSKSSPRSVRTCLKIHCMLTIAPWLVFFPSNARAHRLAPRWTQSGGSGGSKPAPTFRRYGLGHNTLDSQIRFRSLPSMAATIITQIALRPSRRTNNSSVLFYSNSQIILQIGICVSFASAHKSQKLRAQHTYRIDLSIDLYNRNFFPMSLTTLLAASSPPLRGMQGFGVAFQPQGAGKIL